MMSIGTIKVVRRLAVAAVALLLVSCQVATPASRIEKNPVLFDSLPEQDKILVQQGKIRAGMSPQAVFLAWGYPNSQPFAGEKDGKRVVRWVYTTLEPVMVTPAWNGPYWGPGGWYHDYYGVADTAYVPRNSACVTFENDKVISWEARQ